MSKSEQDKKRAKHILLIALSGLAGLFFVFILGMILIDQANSQRVYPRISVDNRSYAGLYADQARAELESQAKTLLVQQVEISVEKGTSQKYSYADIGVSYDTAQTLATIWSIGHSYNFQSKFESVKALIKRKNISLVPNFDKDKLAKVAADFSGKVNDPATDASCKIDNGNLSIVPGKPGQAVDTTILSDQIQTAIRSQVNKVTIAYQIAKPKITEANLAQASFQAQTWLNQKITLSYNSRSYQIGASEIGNWITFNQKNGQVVAEINQDQLTSYLDSIASKINVKAEDRKINSLNGLVISDGQDGQALDEKTAATQITDALNQKGSTEIALVVSTIPRGEKKIANGATTGLYPGKYIEVDLANQQLYQIEGDNIIGQYQVSTGKWSMPTPTGTYAINNKDPRAYSATYGLYMPDWMAFIDDKYGIHALPEWPNGYKEGEAHLGHPVSHGCIRLSDADAETMYNWAEIGTPVVIF